MNEMYFFVRENWTPNTIFYTYLEVTKNTKVKIDCKEDCWEIELINKKNSTFLIIPAKINLQVSIRGLPLFDLEKLINNPNENAPSIKNPKAYIITSRYDPMEESIFSVRLTFFPMYHIEINIEKER